MAFNILETRVERIRERDEPHVRAQRAVDTALEMAQVVETPVKIVPTESSEGYFTYEIQTGVVLDTSILPDSAKPPLHGAIDITTRSTQPIKPKKAPDLTNFTGFRKGTYFRRGIAQPRKRR